MDDIDDNELNAKLNTAKVLDASPDRFETWIDDWNAARALGVPVDYAIPNRESLAQKIARERMETRLSSAPITNLWLRDQEVTKSKIGAADLDALSGIEKVTRIVEAPRAILSSPLLIAQGAYALGASGADAVGGKNNFVSNFFLERAKGLQGAAKDFKGKPATWLEGQAYDAFQSLGLMLPAAALSVASGGLATPLVNTTAFGIPAVTAGGLAAQDALEHGKSGGEALGYGITQASLEVLFEKLPMTKLLGDVAAKSGFAKILTNQLIAEIPTEGATTIAQNLNEWMVINPEKPIADFINEQPEAIANTIIQTVLSVVGLSGAVHGLNKFAEKQKQIEQQSVKSEATVTTLSELDALATASKTKERTPDIFHEAVTAITKDTPIADLFVPAKDFVEYFQGVNVDPFQIADTLKDANANELRAALMTGGSFKISAATFATDFSGTEHASFFKDHATFSPDDMNVKEAASYQSRSSEITQEAFAVAENSRLNEQSLQAVDESVYNEMTSRLERAGRSSGVAKNEAKLISSFYRVMAERSELKPQDYLAQYPLPTIQDGLKTAEKVDGIKEYKQSPLDDEAAQNYDNDINQSNALDGVKKARKDNKKPDNPILTISAEVEQGNISNKSQEFNQGFPQIQRGSIAFPAYGVGKGETIIKLFKSSDLSTFIHETGHYFLTVMQDMASRNIAHATADYAVIKEWWASESEAIAKDAMRAMPEVNLTAQDVIAAIENGTTGDLFKDAAIQVGRQEQTARALEAYLMEGKSPNVDMRGIFEKFRAWLLSVYKNFKSLDVNLSDAMRAVFDRMLATDAEIAQALEKVASNGAVFTTAEQMGVSQEQYDAFLKLHQKAQDEASAELLHETMKPIRDAQQKWYKEEKSKVEQEITSDLQQLKHYRAVQDLRFGKDFAGNDVPSLKLDKDIIIKEYGQDYIKALPGSTSNGSIHRFSVVGKNGVHPDLVAGTYGYADGRELINALTSNPPIEQAIKTRVETVMVERHGDPLRDGSVEEQALNAIHSDQKGQAIAAELKAITDITGIERGLSHKEAKIVAFDIIQAMKVKDATATHRFLSAERKAANQLIDLMKKVTRTSEWMNAARRKIAMSVKSDVKKGEVDRINEAAQLIDGVNKTTENYNQNANLLVDTARQRLLNHYLYNESRNTEKTIIKIMAKLAKLDMSDKKLSKARDVNFVIGARQLAAKFGLARGNVDFDFMMWKEQLSFDDPIKLSAISSSIDIFSQSSKSYKELSVEELNSLNDAITNILEVGKRDKTLEVEGKLIDKNQAIEDLSVILSGRKQYQNEALNRRLTKLEKFKDNVLSIASAFVRMEAWARDMDDGAQGIFAEYFIKPIFSALGTYKAIRTNKFKELLAILEPNIKDLQSKEINSTELNYKFANKGELLHAILHTGNESNKEKLLLGRGWSNGMIDQRQSMTPNGNLSFDRQGNPKLDRGRLDTSRWDQFINRMINEGVIIKADFDMAQQIWDLLETTKRPAQSAHKKIHGFYFKEIEASPIYTPFGTYRGGYVPAVADPNASIDGQARSDKNALEQNQNSFMFPATNSGFTKSRVANSNTPLALNINLLASHMDKVLRFTYLQPAIQQTASLVTDKDLRARLEAVNPNIVSSMVMPWLQRTANQTVETPMEGKGGAAISKVFRELRRRTGASVMFANIVNTAQNITGLPIALILVKPSIMKASFVRFSKGDAAAMIMEAKDASLYMKDRLENGSFDTLGKINEILNAPTSFDNFRSMIDKHTYFLQSALQNPIDTITWHAAFDQAQAQGMEQEQAIFEADSVVRRVMGSFDPENIPKVETGNAMMRLFTMFYSYFNGQLNLVGGEAKTVMRVYGWEGSPRLFWIYLMGIAAPAIIGEAIAQAFRGEIGDDDDDGYADDLTALLFGSQLKYVSAAFPGVGQITQSAMNRFNSNFYDDRLSPSPVLSKIEQLAGAPYSIYNAVANDGSPKRAAVDGLNALGLILGIPTGQLAKISGYGVDVSTGKAEPEGAIDIMQGLISGKDGTAR